MADASYPLLDFDGIDGIELFDDQVDLFLVDVPIIMDDVAVLIGVIAGFDDFADDVGFVKSARERASSKDFARRHFAQVGA